MIRDLFKKDINRTIETVIKADDRAHIADEVTEYVITNEISRKIRDLFSSYNDYSGANGVWISGFFGSGKSHLLKILSYVLENKTIDGYSVGELFAEKIEDDEMLKGDVLAATKIPSESVLFNIDQQAQITTKSDENAVLSVFYKVFYDHLGYYGFQPHIAEFEMWLDKNGNYQKFKDKFYEKNQKPWEKARLDYFDLDVVEILSEINNKDASFYENILDEIEDKHKQSIEDFCNRVNDYILSKGKGFRLNFFVDEVGQYISNNTKLMLNLQTIAETLATKTKGNSWIFVTSQEDMEKVVGDMNKQQQNDFSRIQARFSIKIPLTSANVDEVIEKRLLKKNEEAESVLKKIYHKEHAHLSSLLSFSEAGVQFRGYRDEDDFANKYPFVPYQFDLFQQGRRALSTHNAFQGRHASVGERSMLGVFQQVIQKIEDKDTDALVSFDLLFEGIRNELKSEIQSAIILAENNIHSSFAVRVLKTLFMVKYYGNFKTTKRNISVLMIDDINIDVKEHDKNIQEALNILENQSYIQRNGEVYEFLTNDEKDIEEEIKDTDIDDQAITQLLKEIYFDEIIRDNRIRYIENKQDYDFTSKIDGIALGREKELAIDIITENDPDYNNVVLHQNQTMGSTTMKMLVAPNPTFMKDVKMYLKTIKYIKQKQSTSNRTEIKRILQEKAQLNAERKRNLILMANASLANSTVFINGAKQEVAATGDARARVVNAFQNLIKTVYFNLRMLGNMSFSEDTIKATIRSVQDDLFGTDDQTMSEAESEILNLINRRKKQSDRTTLLDVKNHFVQKPYGWYPNAIWTIIARLYKRGKLEFKQNSNILEDEEVVIALLNSANYGTTVLEPQAEIDPKQVKRLKQCYQDAFDESCPVKEPKDVGVAFRNKLKEMAVDVDKLLAQKRNYSFLESLEPFSDFLERILRNDYHFFLTEISSFEDELLDAKEELLDPIKRFMNGEQRKIYNSIKDFVDGNTANISYIEGDEFETLQTLINSKTPYKGNGIQLAKAAKDSITEKVLSAIEKEKEEAKDSVERLMEEIKRKDEFIALSPADQGKVVKPFFDHLSKIGNERFIANIRDLKNEAVNELYSNQLNEMIRLSTPDTIEDGEGTDGVVSEPKPHYITMRSIKPDYPKTELKTEQDVNEYIEAYRKKLLEQVRNNRRITI